MRHGSDGREFGHGIGAAVSAVITNFGSHDRVALLGKRRKELLQELDIILFDLGTLFPLAKPLIELIVSLINVLAQVKISELLLSATFLRFSHFLSL